MKTSKELKAVVKEKYTEIANQSKSQNETSCCGTGGCCTVDYAVFADDYSNLDGYSQDADLGLGCGLPTEFAQIKTGDKVLDLGSGAGNDCFIARQLVGQSGKVVGLDMTDIMVTKAKKNGKKLGFDNVEFILGDIENIPLEDNFFDVLISNCVLNLVPDKVKAFKEIYRVLKPAAHFSVSDVVLTGQLPEALIEQAELYAGCVTGAVDKNEYLNIIKQTGFKNISIQKEKKIILPAEILNKYLSYDEIETYNSGSFGIYSITIFAGKPLL